MIPISRKPKALTKKLSTPSPGLNGSINEERKMNKNDLLSKFQDPIGDDDDIFGTNEGGINFDDDFNTLKINDLETLRVPQSANNKTGLSFEHDFGQFDQSTEKMENIPNLGMSPIDSISTSSPKSSLLTPSNRLSLGHGHKPKSSSIGNGISHITRKTLSEYSEGDDTDVTSQMNEDDFEDLDNIFGSEESGIYEKINQKLVAKKLKMQNEAELEDMELQKRYKKQAHNPQGRDVNATLKLKDFNYFQNLGSKTLTNQNLSLLDQLENDKTINYEYTRDDFEEFADGFDSNFEKKLSMENRRMPSRPELYQQSTMRNKSSMPNLSRTAPSTIKKYKSSMDIVNAYNSRNNFDLNEADEHFEEDADPGFNYNNNIIRKLDRIPSFYNPKKEVDLETIRKKQQLLNKYAESSQKSSRNAHKESSKSDKSKQKIGLVKYLNNNSIVNDPAIPTSTKSMKFDATNKRWVGNEADLLRFETMHKPSLITLKDLKDNGKLSLNSALKSSVENSQDSDGNGKNPNMVYDHENLRWVNLNDDAESIFNDIPDLEDLRATPGSNGRPQGAYKLTSPPELNAPQRVHGPMGATALSSPHGHQHLGPALSSPMTRRGLSQFTQRTVSSNTNTSASDSVEDNLTGEFKMSVKLIDKFMKEEEKITKKTHHWFPVNEEYDYTTSSGAGFTRDYYWEIRKMVIDNE